LFSMAPLLVMIIFLCSIFFGREAVEGKVYGELQNFLGHDVAVQLQQMIKSAFISGKSTFAAITGGVTLLLGATSIFGEVQDSLNQVWGLKPKPKKGWLKMLRNRFLSFSIIISLGLLLVVSLVVSSVIEEFTNIFKSSYPNVTVVIIYIVNLIVTFAITTIIFASVFKILPDAKIKWRQVIIGAVLTAILFIVGKFAISFYISRSNIGSTYGAAGSLIVLVLWVYYSAIILYMGAEFTKAYALEIGSAIQPSDYAVTTKTVEIEKGSNKVEKDFHKK